MLKQTITIDDAINYLNSILECDSSALRSLLCVRIPCNEKLANHESAQVSDDWDESYTISVIGLINGLFGTHENGNGAIAYMIDENENKLVGFIKTPD